MEFIENKLEDSHVISSMYRILTTYLFLFTLLICNAQTTYSLQFSTTEIKSIDKKIPLNFKDSITVINYLRQLQLRGIEKGYLLCSVDSFRVIENNFMVHFNLGEQLDRIHLEMSKEDLRFLARSGTKIKEKQLAHTPFSPRELSQLVEQLLETGTNNGHPFTKISLDSVRYSDGTAFGRIDLFKGQLFKWQEIHVKGDSSLSAKTVGALIRIKPGELYSENELRMVSERIKQTGYLQEIKRAEVLFTPQGAELFLFLKSVPISSMNGVVGLQPNPVTERISVTGDIHLKLFNVLKRGEQLQLNWRSVQAGVQALNATVNYPFLFKSPFGIDLSFQLYKRDSTFLETRSKFGIQYLLKKGGLLKAFYNNFNSSLLNQIQANNLKTFRSNAYGMSFSKRELDYLPNPTSGYHIHIEGVVGTRSSGIKDSLGIQRSSTFRGLMQFTYFQPFAKRHVLKFSTTSETYFTDLIYRNELYRFGGLTTLRGFNEEEFFASTYSIIGLEYRFLVDKNSHAFLFFDQGLFEDVSGGYSNDQPFGFGAGFSFGTNLGIFSISYALGKQQNNPILLSNGKIHFGYIAYF